MMTDEEQPPRGATTASGISRRHMLMGAAMIGVSGLAFARKPVRRYPAIENKKFEALFPAKFGDWATVPASELVMPPESELANKLYEHITTRTYANPRGDVVMFLVAYSSRQIDDVQVHRPEVCYEVSGFEIAANDEHALKLTDKVTIPARAVLARRQMRDETILYWTRVGDYYPGAWSAQRWAMLTANLEGFYPDGILVRASMVNEGKSDAQVIAELSAFYRDLAAHVSPQARKLLYHV